MIGVYITINGRPIFARTAVNRLKERGVYIVDDGSEVEHNPDDGAIPLAIKLLETIQEDPDKLHHHHLENGKCIYCEQPDTTLRSELADLTAQWATGREDHIRINNAILDLLAKRLPEYRDITDDPHPHPQTQDIYDTGYNEALSEVRAIIGSKYGD